MTTHLSGQGFPGTERFRVEARLGAGASGEVYRVYDRRFGHVVALKTLRRVDPATVYRFKKEFRALADLEHRNLVRLYELKSEEEAWFFTMELVDGPDFLSWVRAAEPAAVSWERDEEEATLAMGAATQERLHEVLSRGPVTAAAVPVRDFARLRDALCQLCEGLAAVHRAGKLHCDIKPTNVRVTTAGRVVLLDFGLVQQLAALPVDRTFSLELSGTPAYMSPEQALGATLGPASDWYAVGALIYEALTGVPPHHDDPRGLLAAKQRTDPTPPHRRVPAVPEDLDRLCLELLRREPDERPHGAEILRRLTGRRARAAERGTASDTAPLVGRREELAELRRALAESRREGARLVLLHGGAGMGKSRLLEHFFERVAADHPDAIVLHGRCYERESVPFKALDAVIDALSRQLRRIEPAELERVLPPGLRALVRLFPVLDRVENVAWAARQQPAAVNAGPVREQARDALRRLLARLAESRPMVIAIDDLQWGDVDSVELLLELLRPPETPRLLLVASYGDEEESRSPALRRLRAGDSETTARARRIPVPPLARADALELAIRLLGDRSSRTLPLARLIARESHGNPFFVGELARLAQSQALEGGTFDLRSAGSVDATFGQLVRMRIAALAPGATRLLAVIAAAGRPLDLQLALGAAGLGDEAPAAVAELRCGHLVRLGGEGRERSVEPYESYLGETVYRALDETTRRRAHATLARALEDAAGTAPDTLALHYRAAGEHDRAARVEDGGPEPATAGRGAQTPS